MRNHWFALRRELSPGRSLALKVASFLLPIGLWCAVSYVPFLWHPMVRIDDPGGTGMLAGSMLEREKLAELNASAAKHGFAPASGHRVNPVFLPAPHEVARAFYTAFTTEPQRVGDVWMHQALGHSLWTIACGFALAAAVGVPIGLLCGTFSFFSRLVEPFVDFVRCIPPPLFAALLIATLGLDDGPKIALIFLGTVFQMIRVVANTTRTVDPSLLEAAQTLGTSRKRLVTRVIIPSVLPGLYDDMRILIGASWTLLTIAELIGIKSGVSFFMDQQGKYRHFDNVFAGVVMIGMLGVGVDKVLTVIGARLFPWKERSRSGFWSEVWGVLRGGGLPRRQGISAVVPAQAMTQAATTTSTATTERLDATAVA
jgi:NitT/TauT family transport system permease protein